MTVLEFLKSWVKTFDASAARDAACTIQLASSQPAYVTVKGAECVLTEGTARSPDLTLTAEDEDLIGLLKGDLNPMTAFMTGKLQLDGDLMLAQKLPTYFPKG